MKRKTTLELKFVLVDDPGLHIFVKAKINGKVANLLVDTGASKTVLDLNRIEKFAQGANMIKNEELSTGLGTTTMQSHSIILNKIQFGDVVIKNETSYLIDLSHVNNAYELLGLKPFDGVLGGDLLARFSAQIDYGKRILVLKS